MTRSKRLQLLIEKRLDIAQVQIAAQVRRPDATHQ